MNTLQRVGIGAAALLLMVGLLAPRSAEATHLRYAVIQVQSIDPVTGTVTYKLTWGARRTRYGEDSNFSYFVVSGPTDSDGNPNVGATIEDAADFEFGDGDLVGDIQMEVTSISPAQDVLIAEATFTHEYGSNAGQVTAEIDNCCRLGGLNNRAGTEFLIETTLDPNTDNQPPQPSVPFIIELSEASSGNTSDFSLSVTDPENDNVTCTLADNEDAVGPSSGGGGNPSGLSIDGSTCTLEWANNGLAGSGLYTAQVNFQTDDGSETEADFFLRTSDTATNNPPVCEFDPATDPINTSVGSQVTFDVNGSDPDDGDVVEITSQALPSGATMDPTLPVTGATPSSTFEWTPSSTGTEFATFVLSDGNGASTQCTKEINVTQQPTCDVPTLAADDVDKQDGTLSNTISDDDGVEEFTFTTLDGFEVQTIAPDANYDATDSDGDGKLDTWTWTGSSGSQPTSVDFTLGATESTATYFLEVTDACTDPGPNTTTFDPAYEFGPVAAQAQLVGNAPNPFSGRTTVEFALPERTRVTVSVYDMMGRKVATLVDGVRSGGSHTVSWNGQADGGQDLASGVYLMRMQADDRSETQRVTIVR